jgi:hypothetical protein
MRKTRKNKPVKQMPATIKILCELTKEPSLNLRKISSRTGIKRSSALNYCRSLVALRFASVKGVAKTNQIIPIYSITLMGKIALFAADYSFTSMGEVDWVSLIQSIPKDFPDSLDKPEQRFTKKLLTELVSTKESWRAYLKWNDQTAKFLLREDLDPVWSTSWYTTIGTLKNRDQALWYFLSINDALVNADSDESFAVIRRLSFLNWLNKGRLVEVFRSFNLNELAANIGIFDLTVKASLERLRRVSERDQSP